MDMFGRYVFRTTVAAFLVVTISLTLVLWFTQAIREFDLVTGQRQAIIVFIGITGLFIPMLVMMIAPIAFVMAAAHVLNKLSSDSEIIVMSAAGVSPWRLLRPLLAAGFLVSLLVAFIAIYLSPLSLRVLRDRLTEIRADILTNIVQPGRFIPIGSGLTFHIAGRRPGGLLLGIFIDDRRDPKEHATYLAEQGEVVKNSSGTFLVLEGGSVQRFLAGERDPRIVTFQNYAFDLSKFSSGPHVANYGAREKPAWELLTYAPKEPLEGAQYRAEFHDRITSLLYPLVFAVVAYMFLGPPQTTRQNRTFAFVGMIGAVVLLRFVGFLSTIVGVGIPAILSLQYIALLVTLVVCLLQISRGVAIEPAASMSRLAAAISDRVAKAG
jgi:lipopolysaccharide export system permease protein